MFPWPPWRDLLGLLAQNQISKAGVVIATAAGGFWLFLLPASSRNPYADIATLALLPALLAVGLILIPVGIWRARRGQPAPVAVDWARLGVFLVATTVVNLVIASQTAWRAAEWMESPGFCGQACHQVMGPHFQAWRGSPHSQVACVTCHIGPGTEWFVRAKMNGVRQAVTAVMGTYHRPIASPHSMRFTRETCEGCHGREHLGQDGLRIFRHYNDDETSSPRVSVLWLNVRAIHGTHVKGSKAMECTQCHNRPAHRFETVEAAADRAIAEGLIPRSLPFAKKRAVESLAAAKDGRDAEVRFAASYAATKDIPAAAVRALYERNVFPPMKVGWGTYLSQLGHNDAPGCFRCHDGAKVTQDCNTCHSLIAMEESDPKLLKDLGVQP